MADEVTPTTGQGDTDTGTGTTAVADAPEVAADPKPAAEPPKAKPKAKVPEAAPQAPAGQKVAAPEKYEFKVPEGSPIDKDDLVRIEAEARELGLSVEDAQKLMEREHKVLVSYQQEQAEFLAAEQAKWAAAVTADPEIGGQNEKVARQNASVALRRFGSPELDRYLEATGLGGQTEVVRFLARIGKAMAPDKAVFGGPGGAEGPTSLKEALYGKGGK